MTIEFMITETELEEAFNSSVQDFLIKEIETKSLARHISSVKAFDKGSSFVVEREGEAPVEIQTKEVTAKAVLRNDYLRKADFEMVRGFFERLSDQIAGAESRDMIETLKNNAGIQVDAKGDILGGLIESLRTMRKRGFHGAPTLIISPEDMEELKKATEKDPERAKILEKLAKEK
jgi:hypothetical protein